MIIALDGQSSNHTFNDVGGGLPGEDLGAGGIDEDGGDPEIRSAVQIPNILAIVDYH